MNKINFLEKTSTIQTRTLFSKDMKMRYLLEMNFNSNGKKACIIMLYPSAADEYIIDQTTQLVRNNAIEQGFGSISIVNLFCSLDLNHPETDRMNSSVVAQACSDAEVIIVAYGRGIAYTEEKESLLNALKTYKEKLYTIVDITGQPYSHPLSPKARKWKLKKLN